MSALRGDPGGFLAALVADLRAFAAELLEVGLAAPAPAAPGQAVPGGMRSLLRLVSALTGVVGRLTDTDAQAIVGSGHHEPRATERREQAQDEELCATRIPKHAWLSRRASDYQCKGGRLLPRAWVTALPILAPDPRPWAWVLFLLDTLAERVAAARERTARHVEDARRARRGTSEYALRDEALLLGLVTALDASGAALARSRRVAADAAGTRLRPSSARPRPYPRGPSWAALHRLADALLGHAASLPGLVHDTLGGTCELADVPFLYQRWVGLKTLQALEAAGLRAVDDPVGALFLGGRVRMQGQGLALTLWCEPRLSRAEHESGLVSQGAEATPDYVLVTPGPGGEDAFVLDATLASDPTLRARKSTYRERLAFRGLRFVAGVPALRRPLRAWSVAPLAAGHCQLDSLDGSFGTIPLHPESGSTAALMEWIGDVVRHARAWGAAG